MKRMSITTTLLLWALGGLASGGVSLGCAPSAGIDVSASTQSDPATGATTRRDALVYTLGSDQLQAVRRLPADTPVGVWAVSDTGWALTSPWGQYMRLEDLAIGDLQGLPSGPVWKGTVVRTTAAITLGADGAPLGREERAPGEAIDLFALYYQQDPATGAFSGWAQVSATDLTVVNVLDVLVEDFPLPWDRHTDPWDLFASCGSVPDDSASSDDLVGRYRWQNQPSCSVRDGSLTFLEGTCAAGEADLISVTDAWGTLSLGTDGRYQNEVYDQNREEILVATSCVETIFGLPAGDPAASCVIARDVFAAPDSPPCVVEDASCHCLVGTDTSVRRDEGTWNTAATGELVLQPSATTDNPTPYPSEYRVAATYGGGLVESATLWKSELRYFVYDDDIPCVDDTQCAGMPGFEQCIASGDGAAYCGRKTLDWIPTTLERWAE